MESFCGRLVKNGGFVQDDCMGGSAKMSVVNYGVFIYF
jgi:hypothetical protein